MQFNLRTLVQVSLLIALSVIFTRFLAINTLYLKIGFGFVPIVICAILFGPWWAGAAYAISDFIGAILFPVGAYFPGFTITAALAGIMFGLLLYKKESSLPRLLAAVLGYCLGISLIGNTFCLTILTGTPFLQLLSVRSVQCVIMIPVMFIACGLCTLVVRRYRMQHA